MNQAIELSAKLFSRAAVQQEWIATNLANLQTPGYKRRIATFVLPPERPDHRGVRAGEADGAIDLRQGDLRPTDAPFDVALDGAGFFVIRTPDGIRYTRNGAFSLGPDGTLIDRSGRAVLGTTGPIRLDGEAGPVTIDETGEIFQDGSSRGKLRVVDFADARRLAPEDGSLLRAQAGMLERSAAATRVRQGYREQANVDEISELVEMLVALRTLEASQRVTQVTSQTSERLVTDR